MTSYLKCIYNDIRIKSNLLDYLSKIIIIIFTILLLILALGRTPRPMGETSSYSLATITLKNRFSMIITPKDIDEAKVTYPEFAEKILERYDDNSYPIDKNGNMHTWYFGIYSFVCILAKSLLAFMGISQAKAFALTNVCIYFIALCVVYKKFRVSNINKLLTILLLTINPAVFYIEWASAEVFIFSFVVMSLVSFTNKEYKKAGILVSIAGTLNPTIMVIGIVFILDYFLCMYKNSGDKNLINILINNIKDIILFGLTFVISIIPLIYNYYYFHSVSLQLSGGGLTTTNLWGRILSYLFDINLGILPYFSVIFILFIIISCIGLLKHDINTILYMIMFYGTMIMFSLMFHINCGMSGIARYNLWLSPIIVFYVIIQIDKNSIKKKIKLFCNSAIMVSLIFSFIIIITNIHYTYIEMSPLAKYVLNNYPELYNPYPYTFISRVNHIDGGYEYDKPVIYTNEEGYVRKILVTAVTVDQINNLVDADVNDLNILKRKIENVKKKKGLQYISLGPDTKIKKAPLAIEFNPSKDNIQENIVSGVYADEGNFAWVSDDAIFYLKNDVYKNNIIIDYDINQLIFTANPDDKINLDIFINDELIKAEEIFEVGRKQIYINKSEIKAAKSFYKIELKTNVYFNPKAMGLSNDNRNLSISIFYVGQQ